MAQLLNLRLDSLPLLPEFIEQLSQQRGKIVFGVLEDPRHLASQIGTALAGSKATLEEKSPNLVDDARTTGDQAVADTVNRLQVELIGGLNGNETHRRPLHSLGDGLGIQIVVLVGLD